jgi:hypothetical protein
MTFWFEKFFDRSDMLMALSVGFALGMIVAFLLISKPYVPPKRKQSGVSMSEPEFIGKHEAAFDPTVYISKKQGLEFLKEQGIDAIEEAEKQLFNTPPADTTKPWDFFWAPIIEHPLDNRMTIAWNGKDMCVTHWMPDIHSFWYTEPNEPRFTHYLTYRLPHPLPSETT